MSNWTGKLFFVGVVAVLVSCFASWILAARYRRRMRVLMSAPATARPRLGVAPARSDAGPAPSASAPVDPAANRRAAWRLSLAIIGVSALIALSAAALELGAMSAGELLTPRRVGLMALIHLWPAIPALGVVWRWSVARVLALLAGWLLFSGAVVVANSIEPRPLQVVGYVAVEVAPSLLLFAALFVGAATRAVAPWLLVPLTGFVLASMLGLDALGALIEKRPDWLRPLPAWLGAGTVFALFAVLPWLLAWWPLKWMARGLARAYARKRLCELGVTLTTAWAVVLGWQALSMASDIGLGAFAMFLPLLWIVIAFRLGHRRLRGLPPPPTLLVLRVFQHDADVQALFDTVVERWRLSGNTLLIAGTDLADRTLDADDIFTFLEGRLDTRFIADPADVEPCLAAFDLAPDDDGRYRVNECYCHDSTWRDALAALVGRSDVVLMDLRGFQAHNAGCLHELGVLAYAPRLRRVVVLVDAATDHATADAATAAAPAGRFVRVEAGRTRARAAREVLARLFEGTASAALAMPQRAAAR